MLNQNLNIVVMFLFGTLVLAYPFFSLLSFCRMYSSSCYNFKNLSKMREEIFYIYANILNAAFALPYPDVAF